MEEKITLNDGTEIVGTHVIPNGNVLWVYIRNGMGLGDVFPLLNDPEKTKKITAEPFGGEKVTYKGYKVLFSIRKEDDGQITAGIRK